ncbi:MAG: CBS domain-containing protein, partial [Chloroflexota bacterium]
MHSTASENASVAALMSHGVQTVEPDAPLETIVRKLRLIGHEGFPVIENGRVIGLLTRRDTDHALEHGLGSLTVRNVMLAGEITLRPEDPIALLEWRMVSSGWGQIPVVDDANKLIGIVTRTDLIKYWAKAHPIEPPESETVTSDQIAAVLGKPVARLIDQIAQQAKNQQLNLYMVGGVVRDLLLRRSNDDIDFVVEGDAIPFAET